jgi:hypothetical protein
MWVPQTTHWRAPRNLSQSSAECSRILHKCSEDPVLSSIVKRYLSNLLTVSFGAGGLDCRHIVEQDHLSKLVSSNSYPPLCMWKLHKFKFTSQTLLKFPVSECIALLKLPTLNIAGNQDSPCSLIYNQGTKRKFCDQGMLNFGNRVSLRTY